MYRLFPNSETSHLSIGSFCGEIRIKQNYDEPEMREVPMEVPIRISIASFFKLHVKQVGFVFLLH